MAKKETAKKFRVGIWQTLSDRSNKSTGLQIWNVQLAKHETQIDDLSWSTVVSAKNDEEALLLGQQKYRETLK